MTVASAVIAKRGRAVPLPSAFVVLVVLAVREGVVVVRLADGEGVGVVKSAAGPVHDEVLDQVRARMLPGAAYAPHILNRSTLSAQRVPAEWRHQRRPLRPLIPLALDAAAKPPAGTEERDEGDDQHDNQE
jgi:hypothetical protein